MTALAGKSMRTITMASIKTYLGSTNNPNKKTLKAIEDAEKGKGLTAHKDMTDLYRKLGIE